MRKVQVYFEKEWSTSGINGRYRNIDEDSRKPVNTST